MNRKLLILALAAAVFAVVAFVPGADVLTVMAWPLTALGAGLRSLSLSGSMGNMVAIAVFTVISAAPVGLWLRSRQRSADALLAVLSVVLAWVLYMMVNPGLRPANLQNRVGDVLYAGCVWSVAITWAVLRLLQSSEEILSGNIYKALRIYLLILAAELVIEGVGLGFAELRQRLESLETGKWFFFGRFDGTPWLYGLEFLAHGAENTLLAVILFKAVDLLKALEADPYSDATIRAGRTVSRWCRGTLAAVTLMDLGLNLGQVIFAGVLSDISVTVHIPAAAIALAFGVLSLTRLLTAGKELKDETDLFI